MSPSPVETTRQEDMHNMFFEWPSTEPHEVIVTGTFDDWKKTKSLNKTARGFVGTVRVPWDSKVKYKFVVDGKWLLLKGQPTEMDPGGYINNIIFTPPKPATTPAAHEVAPVEAGEDVVVVSPPEMPVSAVPIVTVPAPKHESQASSSRLPLIPLNSTEHNTIAGAQAPPPPPDYVLPPSPRASKAMTSVIAVAPPSQANTDIPVPAEETKEEPAAPAPSVGDVAVLSPPEAEEKSLDESPVLTYLAAEKEADEAPKDPSPEQKSRVTRIPSIPLVPLNSTEHNTINNAQVVAPPDFVLPPSPRASTQVSTTLAVVPSVDESEKLSPDSPDSKPPVEALSGAQDGRKALEGTSLLREEQLSAEHGALIQETAPSPEAASAKGTMKPVAESLQSVEKKEGEVALAPTNVDITKTPEDVKHEKDSSSSSSSSSSSDKSDSSKSSEKARKAAAALPSPPATPPSGKHKRYFSFPRQGSPSQGAVGSPATSPTGMSATVASRKKRSSFIAKIKEIFHHEHHDKEPKKSKSERKEQELKEKA